MQHDHDAHLAPVDNDQVFSLTRPDKNLLTLYIIYAAIANVAGLVAFLPLYFHYKTLRYRFDKDGVAVSYGIFWRRESYLTYQRIQDIHVTRNIFERWLGIGRVQIQTAAGSATAAESIVGVREFNEVRNFLYARMRGHKLVNAAEAGTPKLDTMLEGIREELHGIRTIVEGRNDV
ncbi:MAG: PH domain-containing protein [Candidatus Kapaibacterium sp.]